MTDNTPQNTLSRRRGLGRGLDALFEDSEKRAAILPDRAALTRAPITGNEQPDPGYTSDAITHTETPDIVAASIPTHPANTSFNEQVQSRAPHPSVTAATMMTGRLMISVSALCPGINQPRTHFDDKAIEELAASIKIHGVIQPLLVRPIPADRQNFSNATYEIIAGERRWRAAQRAGVHDVPVVVDADMDDRTALQVGIIENVQRADLNPIEEAEGYDRLIREFGYSAERVADLIGKSRPHVANLCRLLQLPSSVRAMVVKGDLSAGHARALVGCKNAEALAEKIIKGKLSVRQTENLVRQEIQTSTKKRAGQGALPMVDDVHLTALQKELTDVIGLKVDIQLDKGKTNVGTVALRFNDLDQMDLILNRIRGA